MFKYAPSGILINSYPYCAPKVTLVTQDLVITCPKTFCIQTEDHGYCHVSSLAGKRICLTESVLYQGTDVYIKVPKSVEDGRNVGTRAYPQIVSNGKFLLDEEFAGILGRIKYNSLIHGKYNALYIRIGKDEITRVNLILYRLSRFFVIRQSKMVTKQGNGPVIKIPHIKRAHIPVCTKLWYLKSKGGVQVTGSGKHYKEKTADAKYYLKIIEPNLLRWLCQILQKPLVPRFIFHTKIKIRLEFIRQSITNNDYITRGNEQTVRSFQYLMYTVGIITEMVPETCGKLKLFLKNPSKDRRHIFGHTPFSSVYIMGTCSQLSLPSLGNFSTKEEDCRKVHNKFHGISSMVLNVFKESGSPLSPCDSESVKKCFLYKGLSVCV